jgi:NADH-quinone oxidoreductase subunit C
MAPAEIGTILEERFGPAITGKKLDTIDPWVTLDVGRLIEICTFLRDDPRLRFDLLNCITGVDYLETDPKKAPKLHASASFCAEVDPPPVEGWG